MTSLAHHIFLQVLFYLDFLYLFQCEINVLYQLQLLLPNLLILLFDVSCWQLLGKESLYLSDDKLILQKKKLFNTKDEFYLKNIESIEIHSHQVNYSKIFLFGLINRETLYLLGLRGKIMIHLLSKKDTIELASGLDDVKAEMVQKELLELIGKTTN